MDSELSGHMCTLMLSCDHLHGSIIKKLVILEGNYNRKDETLKIAHECGDLAGVKVKCPISGGDGQKVYSQ